MSDVLYNQCYPVAVTFTGMSRNVIYDQRNVIHDERNTPNMHDVA